jgi:hypothetical protein
MYHHAQFRSEILKAGKQNPKYTIEMRREFMSPQDVQELVALGICGRKEGKEGGRKEIRGVQKREKNRGYGNYQ